MIVLLERAQLLLAQATDRGAVPVSWVIEHAHFDGLRQQLTSAKHLVTTAGPPPTFLGLPYDLGATISAYGLDLIVSELRRLS